MHFDPINCHVCGVVFTPYYRGMKFCSRPCFHSNRAPIEERFWRFVDNDPFEGCWLWTGKLFRNGYGQITRTDTMTAVLVHRLSYEMHIGPIPQGVYVCHSCDVRHCVNPSHLFLGTHQQNQEDMAKKERCGQAKLTIKKILEIRQLHRSGEWKYKDLARKYGVCESNIGHIITRISWRHC